MLGIRLQLVKALFALVKRSWIPFRVLAMVERPRPALPAEALHPSPKEISCGHLNFGKCEPETVGALLLALSSREKNGGDVTDTWHAVPWPTMVIAHHRQLGKMLWAMCWDLNPVALFRYLRELDHVPPTPRDETAEYLGTFGNMFEVTRTNGVPNFLVIGTRWLIENGYAVIMTQTNGPEMVAPTQKLIDAAISSIRKAA